MHLSGPMKEQLEAVDPEKLTTGLSTLRETGPVLRSVRIDDGKHLLIVGTADPKHRVAFELEKVGGAWKITTRFSADSAVLELLTRKIAPERFNAPATFEVDGKKFETQSAFATFDAKTRTDKRLISIDFHRWPLRQPDLDLFTRGFLWTRKNEERATVNDRRKGDMGFNVSLTLDTDGRVTSYCLNTSRFIDPATESLGSCSQDGSAIQTVTVTDGQLRFAGKGEMQVTGRDSKPVRWKVDLDVPLLKRGVE